MNNLEMDLSTDALLDMTLDDLEDLPSFKPYCRGIHQVLATFEEKEINDSPCLILNFEYIGLVEAADGVSEEDIPNAGDTCNTMYSLTNEFGRGKLKKVALQFKEAFPDSISSLKDLPEVVQNIECVIQTGLTKDKKDPDRIYLDVKNLAVAG